jgi:hypothetical protein
MELRAILEKASSKLLMFFMEMAFNNNHINV